VTQHVVVVRRGRRKAELETPGRRRLEGAFGPAFSAVGKFWLESETTKMMLLIKMLFLEFQSSIS
jgi:hypothetical protein